MAKESLIKRVGEVEDIDGDDFKVGTITGLEPHDNEDREVIRAIRHLNRTNQNQPKGEDVTMTTQTINPTEITSPEALEGTVELKLRKQYMPLVETIVHNNENVIVQDFESYFQLNAKQIKVTRQDAERTLGKMNDGQWRILFMNKKGDVSEFNDYQFVLGVIETEVEEAKETAQLNTRIDSNCKMNMDRVRDMLGMTQSKFLEVVITEYVAKVDAEML
jgi:hypothetical protein